MILKIAIIVSLFVLILSTCLAIVGLIMMDEDEESSINEEIKEEIKRTIIQNNKEVNSARLESELMYHAGWLGGNLEILHIMEKHYGKIIDDDEIIKESEEND